jgi:hypothetical protein
MAIGDNHNDIEMLSFAGIPVVMGNSVPELKAFGWHETGTNDENGVATDIAHFALRRPRLAPEARRSRASAGLASSARIARGICSAPQRAEISGNGIPASRG